MIIFWFTIFHFLNKQLFKYTNRLKNVVAIFSLGTYMHVHLLQTEIIMKLLISKVRINLYNIINRVRIQIND